MNRALCILLIWSVVLVAHSTLVQRECLFTSRWTGTLSSSSMTLTAWLPEEEETTTDSSPLSVILSSDATPSSFCHIDLWRSIATIKFSKGNDSENISTKVIKYGEELRVGWSHFNVSRSSTGLDIWYMSHSKLLSLDDTFGLNNVTIEGTDITVNCHKDLIGWSLAENGGSVIIPLSKIKPQHAIFLYSETDARPSLSFPPDSKNLHISWNGTSLYANTSLTQGDQKDPLSPSVLYNLRVSCQALESRVECSILTAEASLCLETMEFETMPRNIKISAPSVDNLFVFIPRVTSIFDDLTLAEQQESEAERLKVSTVIVIVILTLVFLGIILLVLISSILQSRDIKEQKRGHSITAKVLPDQEEPLIRYHHDSPVPLPRASIIMEEQNLWEAVQEGNIDVIKSLLEEGHLPDEVEFKRFTTPFLDAHMIGSKEVVRVFSEFKGEKYTTAPDDLIKTVLYELERNMKDIFLAAECGIYDPDGGVDYLLKAYNLPGTITDSQGRSIIHYMASVTLMDGIPVWQPKDIRKFFASHEHYANAVDHLGRTALHELSQHPKEVEMNVIWDGKEWSLPDAWLALARLLVSYGCDPRIPDHKGQLAHELAQAAGNYDLAKFLEQKCSELGHINIEKGMDQFDSLVSAVRQGNTQQMRDLLLRHVPLLPLSAKSDLLVEAILNQNRNALLLLLAAEAPLCNRTVGDVTPLEVAHNTLGLPACFPALIRKAYYERLENEISHVPTDNEALAPLRQSMTAYNLQVMDVGSKAKWIFSVKEHAARCQEARGLLVQAAELGLSFTCQLLALEDLYLHSLPDEPKAFHRAMINKHQHTQLVLYRDLGMSPFTSSSSEEVLYWQLLENLWVNEMKALEALYQRESKSNERLKIKSIVVKLRKLNESVWDQEDEAEESLEFLLYMLARHGLITILHVVLSKCPELHPDKIAFSSYRCTMLHIAAAFGKMNILEYLMHIGASLDLLCIGNYTPAHMAAVSGHKKCFEYIRDYMKSIKADTSKQCHVKLTASELMAKYEKLCDNSGLPLLGHEDALFIKNEQNEHAQTYEILKRRGSILMINTPADLLRTAKTILCRKPYTEEIEHLISCEMNHLGNLITESGYQGKFIPVGACSEGNEVLCVQNINYIFEVSDFGINEDLNYQDDEKDEKITIVIESKPENSLYIADAYIRSFVQRLIIILSRYKPSTSKLSFAPPFVDWVSDGACVYWIINYEHGIKFIQTFIKPVIPVTCPSDDINDTLPPEVGKYVVAQSDIQLHLINEFGEWTYCASIIENFVFQELNKNQRTVWITCRLLVRLLRSTWWAPRFNVHFQNKSWHTLSVGIESLTERGLKSLFLQELAESQDWSTQHLFQRVISVFSRACKRDMRGKWAAREYVNSFLTPRHFCCNVGTSVCGIMQYLEELSQAEPHIPDKTVKFIVP